MASVSAITSDVLLKHITALADDKYKGRDSPSVGLDEAGSYIRAEAAKNGLVGANTASTGDAFLQPFTLYGFSPLKVFQEKFTPQHDKYMPGIYGPRLCEYAIHDAELAARKSTPASPVAAAKYYEWGKVANVVGLLEGSDPALKDEFIIVSAHYDHIGVRRTGKDRIYNGADDNASGSAVLLSLLPELARLRSEGKGPKRSVLFIWTAAEEKGLVGADYYRLNPLRPLSKTTAAINVDMVARLSADQISVCDTDHAGTPNLFRRMVAGAAMAAGFTTVNRDVDGYLDSQDGGIWAAAGIPTAFLFEGFTPDGRLNPDYHGVDDEIEGILKDNGGEKVARVARMTLDLLLQAANR